MQNANVHPVFAEVLGRFAAIPQQVAAARAVKCRVTVKTEDGEQTHDSLFPSTCDAVIDAAEHVGQPGQREGRQMKKFVADFLYYVRRGYGLRKSWNLATTMNSRVNSST